MNSGSALDLALRICVLLRGDFTGSADLRDCLELDITGGGVYSSSPSSVSTTHDSLSWGFGCALAGVRSLTMVDEAWVTDRD